MVTMLEVQLVLVSMVAAGSVISHTDAVQIQVSRGAGPWSSYETTLDRAR